MAVRWLKTKLPKEYENVLVEIAHFNMLNKSMKLKSRKISETFYIIEWYYGHGKCIVANIEKVNGTWEVYPFLKMTHSTLVMQDFSIKQAIVFTKDWLTRYGAKNAME